MAPGDGASVAKKETLFNVLLLLSFGPEDVKYTVGLKLKCICQPHMHTVRSGVLQPTKLDIFNSVLKNP